jgi:hypothetical protein
MLASSSCGGTDPELNRRVDAAQQRLHQLVGR